jgi:hypothetical protein
MTSVSAFLLEHAPDVNQLARIYDGVNACDQVLLDAESQHGGDFPVAQGYDAGLTVDLAGGQGRSRVAEESHDLLGDRFAADSLLHTSGGLTAAPFTCASGMVSSLLSASTLSRP